jgi:lysophospholipase L1-like esterase
MAMKRRAVGLPLVLLLLLGSTPCPADEAGQGEESWAAPMRKVHAEFTGERGTFAHFGDSITVTMAFWAPLRDSRPKNMDEQIAADYKLVKGYMQEKCWREWKGARHGNTGSMTIRWAHQNIDDWLNRMNPEVVLIMFGTNDLNALDAEEYEQKTREVVRKCLANGTVVILSTIPPRHGRLEKAERFAKVVRRLGQELKVPVCDYMAEILKRRPDDWDGTLPKFADRQGYQVLTLIAGDGVHPSNPQEFRNDFSQQALRTSGYTLRNYLVLRAFAGVLRNVLDAKESGTAGEPIPERREP